MNGEQREADQTFKLFVHVRMEYAIYDEIQGSPYLTHSCKIRRQAKPCLQLLVIVGSN